MDKFKKKSIAKATEVDYNASCCDLGRGRKNVSKFLSRFSRRKLKEELREGESNGEQQLSH